MSAHHKTTDKGVGRRLAPVKADPHAGPQGGDATFRYYFDSPEEYLAAMKLAASLEARGLPRRAWRVRLNLDKAR